MLNISDEAPLLSLLDPAARIMRPTLADTQCVGETPSAENWQKEPMERSGVGGLALFAYANLALAWD